MASSGTHQLSRREVAIGAASTATLLMPAASQLSAAPAIANGFVFEDADGTGVRASGAPGVGNVMVSNGRDVVLTAQDGSWRLPVRSGDSIFVIKPSGWAAPILANGRLDVSYLHQPEGSTRGFASRFTGVAPTGRLPESIDFALRRSDEPSRFEVLLVADTQPSNAEELGFVRDTVLSRVPGSGASLAIHHGDVMGDDLSLFERYQAMLGATGIPWHHCPGNHDMNLDAGSARHAFESWKRVFGPSHYAFQHGEATFILLNNVRPLDPHDADKSGRGYRGMIGDTQLAFVANVLRRVPLEQLVVISMHIPLLSCDDPTSTADNTVDRHRLLELLAGRPHCVSFSGHSHTTEHHYLGDANGGGHHHHVLTAACGSWWSGPRDSGGIPHSVSPDGSPKGFHILSVDGNRYSTRFEPLGDRAPAQMRVMLDNPRARGALVGSRGAGRPLSRQQLDSTRLLVNIFDGGPRTRCWLDMPVTHRAAVELVREDIIDPFVVEFLAANATTCKPWAAPAKSSHLWALPLPPDLPAGVHLIRVRAVGEYGNELADDMLIEITA